MQQNIKLRYANEEYFDSLLAVVSKACDSAGNKSREFLNMAMKEAVIQEYIKRNPISATKSYPRKKPTIIILNKANVKKLLKAAYNSGWYLEILLGLFCGLRKGEISGLKFGDFDAENRTIYIQRQITSNPVIPKGERKIKTYEVIEKPPKTDNSYRLLRIPEAVAAEIERRRILAESNKQQYGEQYFEYNGTFVVYAKVNVADYMMFWLETDLKKRTDSHETYYNYCGIVKNHIIPILGKKK